MGGLAPEPTPGLCGGTCPALAGERLAPRTGSPKSTQQNKGPLVFLNTFRSPRKSRPVDNQGALGLLVPGSVCLDEREFLFCSVSEA